MSEALPPPASKDYAGPIDQNGWLVEEKYQQFLVNPAAVDESWRALFANGWDRRTAPMRPSRAPTDAPAVADVRPVVLLDRATPERSLEPIHTEDVAPSPAPAHAAAPAPAQVSAPAQVAAEPEGDATKLLRGAPAKLAQNMISSLGVPTATSVHPIPATVLEENRRLINEHLSRSGGKKVSFTHLIAYAILRGLRTVPVLNSTFVPDADGSGTPGVIAHAHVGLGLAIDLEKRGGGRSLVVAAIHDADLLGFTDLVGRYDDIVRRAREGALTADDFSGVTVSITNPGGLGTTQSVPRLMPGQGVIVGIGAIDYPVEFAATDLETLKSLGIGKVVTLTSTYDHRIIQGAESGLFLKRVHELLVGEHGFYEDVFSAIGLAAPPIHLSRDRAAAPPRDNGDARIATLIDAYRTLGHHAARLDPLAEHAPPYPPELDPTYYGLSVFDLGRTFDTGGFFGSVEMTLGEILERLRGIYCGTVGIEYRHIQAGPERAFFQARLESSTIAPTPQQMLRRLNRLERAETFERFLQTRYVGVKRFSGEGGESATVFLDEAFEQATADGVAEAVVGTAHRGRLGILVNIIGKPLTSLFAEFEDNLDPLTVDGSGDVKYHKGGKGTWTGLSGRTLTASLASNPSHLETVDPVVEGIARAQQDLLGEGGESAILPLLIHGDASMAGQGVVAETLNLSLVPAYRTGGTLHLIINNQIGFTTDWQNGRSTKYASDVAKMIEAPILHVNADDPDAVATVARLAVAYRTAFAKDVVVDLVCYRFHGHNEADDPTYTQPVMYRKIASHDSARTIYATKLIELGVLTADEAAERLTAINAELAAALAITRQTPNPPLDRLPDKPFVPMPPLSTPDGVDQKTLDSIVGFLHTTPSGFHLHPKLARQFGQRLEQFDAGEVDWAHGEAMAYATLVLEGTSVRLIGQDAARGTFSHRQAVLSDYETGATYTPLEALARGEVDGLEPEAPAEFKVWDSALTEYAGLGFEYGYTVGNPLPLVIWEAQFGDFANGAQIVLDNYISASEEKWGQRSGIVMLLPHGYEGQGPEHSSARIERYLQLSSGENISVVQPTTSAQFFHLIRAHAHLEERRPLIVITPKSLLRSRFARSKIDEFVSGAFRTVIDDPPKGSPDDVRRVVLCSGRVADDLIKRRNLCEEASGTPVAIVRIEQLSPWPKADVTAALAKYPRTEEVVWAQDEPENMGALTFAVPRIQASVGSAAKIYTASRRVAGSPATGSHEIHDLEVGSILDRAIGRVPS